MDKGWQENMYEEPIPEDAFLNWNASPPINIWEFVSKLQELLLLFISISPQLNTDVLWCIKPEPSSMEL